MSKEIVHELANEFVIKVEDQYLRELMEIKTRLEKRVTNDGFSPTVDAEELQIVTTLVEDEIYRIHYPDLDQYTDYEGTITS